MSEQNKGEQMALGNATTASAELASVHNPSIVKTNQMYQDVYQRSATIHIDQIRADYDRNIRIRSGQQVEGILFNVDGYDTETMKQQIMEVGIVREPLMVAQTFDTVKDEKSPAFGEPVYDLLRGFRRYDASVSLVKENILKDVLSQVKVIIVTKQGGDVLERKAADLLINDQTAKPFNAFELWRDLNRSVMNGQSWYDYVLPKIHQFSQALGNTEMPAEINKIKSKEDKVKLIKAKWTNSIGQFWVKVGTHGGPFMRMLLANQLAIKSGLTGEGMALDVMCGKYGIDHTYVDDQNQYRPFVKVPKLTSLNVGVLFKAIEKDDPQGIETAKGNYGPEFKKEFLELLKKDATPKGQTNKPKSAIAFFEHAKQFAGFAPLSDIVMSFTNNPEKTESEPLEWHKQIRAFYGRKYAYQEIRDTLKPDTQQLLDMVFGLAPGETPALVQVEAGNQLKAYLQSEIETEMAHKKGKKSKKVVEETANQ